ncbi:MAG TPA: hypothetical protein VJ227_03020 [Patescibacteria group bacterium]|nr:hypothetical protein [Patescibacteria group bacterium]
MYFVLAIVIVLYSAFYLFLAKNPIFLRYRKWVDGAAVFVSVVILIVGLGVFHYSYFFIIYFLVSLGVIFGLTARLRKLEDKKKKAEETITVLKDEERVLEEEIENLEEKKPVK